MFIYYNLYSQMGSDGFATLAFESYLHGTFEMRFNKSGNILKEKIAAIRMR